MNARTVAAMRAFGCTPAPESTPESNAPPAVPSFDGGARQTPALEPEDHGTWLLRRVRGEPDPPPADWPWPSRE